MYKIRIEKGVQKSLEKISEPYYSKIKTAILNLAKNPRPQALPFFSLLPFTMAQESHASISSPHSCAWGVILIQN